VRRVWARGQRRRWEDEGVEAIVVLVLKDDAFAAGTIRRQNEAA
jgi:hypothetical protein